MESENTLCMWTCVDIDIIIYFVIRLQVWVGNSEGQTPVCRWTWQGVDNNWWWSGQPRPTVGQGYQPIWGGGAHGLAPQLQCHEKGHRHGTARWSFTCFLLWLWLVSSIYELSSCIQTLFNISTTTLSERERERERDRDKAVWQWIVSWSYLCTFSFQQSESFFQK